MTFETYGIRGAFRRTRRRQDSSSARIGSIIAEWKACEVGRRRHATPRRRSRASSAVDRRVRPRDHALARRVDRGQRQLGAQQRLAPPPRAAAPRASRPRGKVLHQPPARGHQAQRVLERDSTPARQAATYSPTLWPIIAARADAPGQPEPAARAYSTAKSAGWASQVSLQPPLRRLLAAAGRVEHLAQVEPELGAQQLAAAVELARGRPARRDRARRPCRRAARPGPGTGRPPGGRPRRPRSRSGCASGSAPASVRRPRPCRRQTTARRCAERAPADLQGVGDVGQVAPGLRPQVRRAGPPPPLERRLASAPRAPGAATRPRRPAGRRGGASSSTTWALVPPMPNELTPARRGAVARPVGAGVVLT